MQSSTPHPSLGHLTIAAYALLWSTGTMAAAPPPPLPLPPPPPPTDAIAACMERAATSLGFNGSAEARFGTVTVEKFFGSADAAGKTPVAAATRFNLGSASKMFTAVAIGRLVDRGAVQFDAPIGRYLPDLKPPFAAITVAELLEHTAGLGDYFQPKNAAAIAAAHTATDLLPLVLAEPPAFAPGSRRAYSNSGFVVLGVIIEKVSGLTYQAFLEREIFDPLGMRHTRADGRGAAEPMSRMSPDGTRQTPAPVRMPPLRASAAGGMFSTPADVAVFLSALADGRLMSRATTATMLEPRADPAGGPGTYGYGFNVSTTPRKVGHGGGAPGVNAEIALYPDSRWQLIALANRDPPVASQMVAVLERALSGADTASACAAALSDPDIQAMGPPTRLRMGTR